MKKALTLFVIVALFGSCKKEENKAPTTPTTPTTTYLFNAVYTYGDPAAMPLYLGFVLKVNGVTKTVPVNVAVGDVLVITAHDNLGNGYMISTLLDGVEFPGGMYGFASMHYGDYIWTYTVN